MTADYEFKIIVVGDSGVGKTSMIASLLGDPLPLCYVQTQGTKVHEFRTIHQNKKITLKIWDMSGGDKYRTYIAGCFDGAHGAIISYSMIDSETYLDIKNWYDTISSTLEIKDPNSFESLQTIVVGMKSDSKMISVTPDQGESAAQSIGCSHFIGTYKDPKSYKTAIYGLIDMLLAQAKQTGRDAQLKKRREEHQTGGLPVGPNDPTQPLLDKKHEEAEEEKSIFDCGCGCGCCTIL